jgi:predicted double-glycine peptidase
MIVTAPIHFHDFIARLRHGMVVTAIGMGALATHAGSVEGGTVFLPYPLGGPANVEVISLREARFQTVIRQQFDFSCGSAALATLLTYHYEHPVTEIEVFKAMYDVGDQERIQTYGFSLLDMKRFLEGQGFKADGFKVDLDRLEKAAVPALVLINTHGYRHFVLIKGIYGNEVVVGDPALGVRVMPKEDFLAMWNGIAFLIRSNVTTGRKNYNMVQDWGVRKRAPFGSALSRQSLASFTTHLTHLTNSF